MERVADACNDEHRWRRSNVQHKCLLSFEAVYALRTRMTCPLALARRFAAAPLVTKSCGTQTGRVTNAQNRTHSTNFTPCPSQVSLCASVQCSRLPNVPHRSASLSGIAGLPYLLAWIMPTLFGSLCLTVVQGATIFPEACLGTTRVVRGLIVLKHVQTQCQTATTLTLHRRHQLPCAEWHAS